MCCFGGKSSNFPLRSAFVTGRPVEGQRGKGQGTDRGFRQDGDTKCRWGEDERGEAREGRVLSWWAPRENQL